MNRNETSMSSSSRTAVKRVPPVTHPSVVFVTLWSSDDDDGDGDDEFSSTQSMASSCTSKYLSSSSKHPVAVQSAHFAKSARGAQFQATKGEAQQNNPKRVSYLDDEETTLRRRTVKKPRTESDGDTAGEFSSVGSDASSAPERDYDDNLTDDDDYRMSDAQMHRIEYERRCAALRLHSGHKMFYSRTTTQRLRGMPQHSPLFARKLRF